MRADRRRFLKAAGATLGAVSLAPTVLREAFAQANVIKVAAIHDLSGGLDIYGRPMVDWILDRIAETSADEIHLVTNARFAGDFERWAESRRSELAREYQETLEALAVQAGAGQPLAQVVQLALGDPDTERADLAVVHAGITSASREAIRPVLKRFNTLYFYNTQYEGGVCDRNCFCTGSTPAQNVDKLVPFTLNGFAVREAFFVSFLGGVGVGADQAFAAGFLFFLVTVAMALPGGAILLWEGVRGGARPRIEHG